MKNYQHMLKSIADHVAEVFLINPHKNLLYHDLKHTKSVVKKTMLLADAAALNESDRFIVTTAAWFHDLGYLVSPEQHEKRGADLASAFLRKKLVEEDEIESIGNCILATRLPQEPVTLLEQILCDADLFHLGSKKFFENDEKLRKENKLFCGINPGKAAWYRQTIGFLESHHYFTTYGREFLEQKKEENLARLRHLMSKFERTHATDQRSQNDDPAFYKKERPEKGIETMFKISSGNHQRLSGMADNKAHIMITVNSIILSAIISLLLRKLTEYGYLLIPTCILLAVSLLAMTFSILATRPSIPAGTFLRREVDEKKVNLLFFGNFFRMPLADFTYGMEKMMEDHELLYGSLIRDVYAQGVVLGKKYRLLRAAYNVFMYGLIAAVAAFLIAAIFFSQPVRPVS